MCLSALEHSFSPGGILVAVAVDRTEYEATSSLASVTTRLE